MSTKAKIILGFATIYLVWGSTYLAIRLGVETMPPFLLAGIRFVIGGTLLYAWSRMRGAERPERKHKIPALILGLLLPLGGTGLVTLAEKTVPSGLAALLVATVPLWIVLVDWLRPGGSRPRRLVVAGLALGFTGIAMLILPSVSGTLHELSLIGALTVVVASLSWATGSIYSKYAPQPKSKVMGTGMQMIAGGSGLLMLSLITGEMHGLDLAAVTLTSWLSLAYLITAGSVAFAAYIWLISEVDPSKVATYAYVNPVIAIFLGAVIADELMSSWTMLCSMIIIAAVFMVISSKRKASEPKEQPLTPGPTTTTLATDSCSGS